MSEKLNPAAPHNLPAFITAPGEADVLLYVMVVVLLLIIVGLGVLYLRLHALPEHIAHRTDKIQLQIVAVLALLALFTHNHVYWIAALLLALIRLPDFSTPLVGMAASLAKMAERKPPTKSEPAAKIELVHPQPLASDGGRQAAAERKDLSHA